MIRRGALMVAAALLATGCAAPENADDTGAGVVTLRVMEGYYHDPNSETPAKFDATVEPLGVEVVSATVAPGEEEAFDVVLEFSEDSANKLLEFSSDHTGRVLAILDEEEVLQAFVLIRPVSEQAVISNRYTKQEAEALVQRIMG